MKLLQIHESVDKGKNLIFYNKDVYDCYEELENEYLVIYFNEPIPVKGKLIKIVDRISNKNRNSLNRLTIEELKELLFSELKYDRLIITFNHFERLTKRTVQIYQYLNTLSNVQFICSFSSKFKPEVYPFYKKFELANKEEYEKAGDKNEIDITYPVFVLIALFCFIFYLKTSTSLFMAFIFIGAAWFALIVFRTVVYLGGSHS